MTETPKDPERRVAVLTAEILRLQWDISFCAAADHAKTCKTCQAGMKKRREKIGEVMELTQGMGPPQEEESP